MHVKIGSVSLSKPVKKFDFTFFQKIPLKSVSECCFALRLRSAKRELIPL
jgi:hypothetical protein